MAQFKLEGKVTVTIVTAVEADTLEEAIKIGFDREVGSVIIPSFYDKEEYWIFAAEEIDGMAKDITGESC